MTMADLTPAAEKLLTTVWKTQGARLVGYRRLKAMHRWSLWTIAITSIYVIGLSASPVVLDLPEVQSRWLALVAAVSAVGILILSLMEAGERYEVRAERMHECALELGRLCGTLDIFLASPPESGADKELNRLRSEYDGILATHKENHEPVDFEKFLASRPDDFPTSALQRLKAITYWWYIVYWRFALLILVPPVVLMLLFVE